MKMKAAKNTPWYVESFKQDYLHIYAHRDDRKGDEEIEAIVQLLKMKRGSSVLDLCCGYGRHSRALARRGFVVTGYDLSEVLLEEARRRSQGLPVIRYVQGDVRQLPFYEEFDYVLNLFTSFGYFERQEENQQVFNGIFQSLKKGGVFLIDFLNPPYVQAHLKPFTQQEVNGMKIIERRKIENGQVIKTIEVYDGDEVRHYEERVKLFTADEMVEMIVAAGLEWTALYGNLQGEKYDVEHSPRMVLVGRKPAPKEDLMTKV